MAPNFSGIITGLPADANWGPQAPTEAQTLINDVPYAPYSKGDKLGRLADWSGDGKGDDRRGGRFNRNYRGKLLSWWGSYTIRIVHTDNAISFLQISKSTELALRRYFHSSRLKMSRASRLSTIEPMSNHEHLSPGEEELSSVDEVAEVLLEVPVEANVNNLGANKLEDLKVIPLEDQEITEVADLDGRITTSLKEIEIRQSLSSLIGACWRKSTFLVCPSSTSKPTTERMLNHTVLYTTTTEPLIDRRRSPAPHLWLSSRRLGSILQLLGTQSFKSCPITTRLSSLLPTLFSRH